MNRKRFHNCLGFTFVELIIAILLSFVLIMTVGFAMADTQRAWGVLHDRVFSKMAEDGYTAGLTFEAICRKSSRQSITLGSQGVSCKFDYYENIGAESPDRYAQFYVQSGKLYLKRGTSTGTVLSNVAIAENVQSVQFVQNGNAVRMQLVISSGGETAQFVNFAIRNAP